MGWVLGGYDPALQAQINALGTSGTIPIARLKLQAIADELEHWTEAVGPLPTSADLMVAITRIKEISGAAPEPTPA